MKKIISLHLKKIWHSIYWSLYRHGNFQVMFLQMRCILLIFYMWPGMVRLCLHDTRPESDIWDWHQLGLVHRSIIHSSICNKSCALPNMCEMENAHGPSALTPFCNIILKQILIDVFYYCSQIIWNLFETIFENDWNSPRNNRCLCFRP